MQFSRTLSFLIMSMLLLGSFSQAAKAQATGRCDFWFQNDSYTTVSAAVFQTSQQTLIYTNTPPGGTHGSSIGFVPNTDNFTYILTFPAATTRPITVDVYYDHTPQGIQTIPVGVSSFIFTVPGPLPGGAIYVYLK
jgi:hypothetical protein